jgi:hypothetical protein
MAHPNQLPGRSSILTFETTKLEDPNYRRWALFVSTFRVFLNFMVIGTDFPEPDIKRRFSSYFCLLDPWRTRETELQPCPAPTSKNCDMVQHGPFRPREWVESRGGRIRIHAPPLENDSGLSRPYSLCRRRRPHVDQCLSWSILHFSSRCLFWISRIRCEPRLT